MLSEVENLITCPKCGTQLNCHGITDESLVTCPQCTDTFQLHRPTISHQNLSENILDQQAEHEARVIACPQCAKILDVSGFDPLEFLTCPFCNHSFELLKQFADYQLFKSYDAGWNHALYLARHHSKGSLAIIKVLSSHVLAQPNAYAEFIEEAQSIISSVNPNLTDECHMGEIHGFQFLEIPLKAGVTGEQFLESLGCTFDAPETKIKIEEKKISCPYCNHPIDATLNDPLDSVHCPSCRRTFELLRKFSNYRIDYRLRMGGTSILYLAQDLRKHRKVALKVLSANEIRRDPSSHEKFLRELELTKLLRHPNVIQVYDGGVFQGFYYMALELVNGLALNEILSAIQQEVEAFTPNTRNSPAIDHTRNPSRFKQGIPELVCIEIALQAAAGLGVAHDHSLVHGDIKPENIMITNEGIVKVLDFGLVQFANTEKLLEEGEQQSIYGTPLYIPPERVFGEPEDFRSDIYSLGATFYHLLRGVPPFSAKTPEEVAMMHAECPLVSFRAYVPWLSEPSFRIIEKSLKKNVSERYASHLEFISDLTLAKNLILQSMNKKSVDGKTVLKKFIRSLPSPKRRSGVWARAKTVAVHTYHYVTIALTTRIRKLLKRSR